MNQNFDNFMADLNALVRHLPAHDIECVLWLNSLMFNATQTIEAIQRDDLSKEYGGTD